MTTIKEEREKVRTRRDKLGGYFLTMSQLAFAGMVIGGLTPLFNNHSTWDFINIALGIVASVTFALIGNNILK